MSRHRPAEAGGAAPRARLARSVSPALAGLCLALAVSAPLAPDARAVTGVFRQIDLEGGGWVTGLQIHSSGRLYARTDVGGCYRSDDAGLSWFHLGHPFQTQAGLNVQSLAVSRADPDLLFQASGTSQSPDGDPDMGVWRSADGGRTWEKKLSGAAIRFSANNDIRHGGECLVIDPGADTSAASPRHVYAGTRGGGLHRSLDTGETWTRIDLVDGNPVFADLNISSVAIDPSGQGSGSTPATRLWVAGDRNTQQYGGGIWVSANAGVTWKKVFSCLRVWKVQPWAGALYASISEGPDTSTATHRLVRLTLDNWTGRNATLATVWGTAPGPISTLHPLANGSLLAATRNNGARAITYNAAANTHALTPVGMAVSPSAILPAWQSPASGLQNPSALVQDPTSLTRWFAGSGFSPLLSEDSGATWSFINNGFGEFVSNKPAWHPTDPARLYFTMQDVAGGFTSDGGDSGVADSIIAGSYTWPESLVFSNRALVSSTKVMFFGGRQGFDDDDNIGRVWERAHNASAWTRPYDDGLPLADGGLVQGILLDAFPIADDLSRYLVFSAGSTRRVGGTGGIYLAAPDANAGGATRFTKAAIDSGSAFPADKLFGNYAYNNLQFGGDRRATGATYYLGFSENVGFYRSTDAGANWTRVSTPGDRFRFVVDPFFTSSPGGPNRLWLATYRPRTDFPTGLYISDNRGDTWNAVPGFVSADEVDARDRFVVVVGRRTGDPANRIYASDDNGATWHDLTVPGKRFGNATWVTLSPHRRGEFILGTGGRSFARFVPDSGPASTLANGGFESGFTNWNTTAYGSSTPFLLPDGPERARAARVGPGSGGFGRYVQLGSTPPEDLVLSFWARPATPSSSAATLRFWNASGQQLGADTVVNIPAGYARAWEHHATAPLTVPPGATQAQLFTWKNTGQGYLSFDDFRLVPPGNLVLNGALDSTLTSWTVSSTATASIVASGGSLAGHARLGASVGGLTQNISLAPLSPRPAALRLKFAARSASGAVGAASLKFFNASWGQIGASTDLALPSTATGWTDRETPAVAIPAGAAVAQVVFWKNTAAGQLDLDRVRLVPTP